MLTFWACFYAETDDLIKHSGDYKVINSDRLIYTYVLKQALGAKKKKKTTK
jgi:hypothetical protein